MPSLDRDRHRPCDSAGRAASPDTPPDTSGVGAAPTHAWNLVFGATPEAATEETAVDIDDLRPPPLPVTGDRLAWGWIGDAGPAIGEARWPRSPRSGLPMRHAITLRLPPDYQRRGPALPGVSYFLGEGQFAVDAEAVGPEDPFIADLRRAEDHPRLSRRSDLIGQSFAVIWLDERELTSGPQDPPPDVRRPGEHVEPEGDNAWDAPMMPAPGGGVPTSVYLAPRRADPNLGIPPTDATGRWVAPFTENGEVDPRISRDARHDDHLGGSSLAGVAAGGLTADISPFYLELAVPTHGRDYGNGEAHVIDLDSDAFEIA